MKNARLQTTLLPMFPLIFQSLCVHKISFVQYFTRTHLYLEWRIWNMCKIIFVRSKFSCVHLSHGLCVGAQAQPRGNIAYYSYIRKHQSQVWRKKVG